MKLKYGAKNDRSLKCRFHTQTAGCSLTAQQPEINIARTSFQALAGVLGGTQSLHTNSMDETLALPTEKAAEIALRTQQLIAYETGVANVVDPLGGSWFIEHLTDEIEKDVEEYFEEINNLGGVIPAIEQGYFQREIAKSASEYQRKVDENKRIVVGVNKFVKENEELDIPVLEIDPNAVNKQLEKLKILKKSRNNTAVSSSLKSIRRACKTNENLMPVLISAAKSHVTLGEIITEMKKEFGEWQENTGF